MKIETILPYVLLEAEMGFAFFTFLSSAIMNTSLCDQKTSYITSYIDLICDEKTSACWS